MTQLLGSFLVGVLVGAAGQYFATKFTDQRRQKEGRAEVRKAFAVLRATMPELLDEMRQDLAAEPLVREFILLRKGTIFGYPRDQKLFTYYYQAHDSLREKVSILEERGFIQDVSINDVPRFRMTDALVSFLVE